MTHAVYS